MNRTPAAPPTDRSMWRRLLALAHPDRGGDRELFLWAAALREHVVGDGVEDARSDAQRRKPPPQRSTGERVDYAEAFDKAGGFSEITRRGLEMAEELGEPYSQALRLLESCREADELDLVGLRAQPQGATYKQLAAIARLVGMGAAQRREWYRIARSIPLSKRHAGHILFWLTINARSDGYDPVREGDDSA